MRRQRRAGVTHVRTPKGRRRDREAIPREHREAEEAHRSEDSNKCRKVIACMWWLALNLELPLEE